MPEEYVEKKKKIKEAESLIINCQKIKYICTVLPSSKEERPTILLPPKRDFQSIAGLIVNALIPKYTQISFVIPIT